MKEENSENKIINYGNQLADHQENFLKQLSNNGLPVEGIFVPLRERIIVFSNAGLLLENIDLDRRLSAVYISKFFAAVSAGLFDAALNYIWDETILHLRKRVETYDLEYFYDIATSADKRKDLKTIDDISKLTDDELLRGSLSIELISEVGYRNMDLVKYMRNNASAAHPNQLDITGLKLTSMAEDCLREVISTPIPPAAITVQKLLENIKNNPMTLEDAKGVSVHFPDMGPNRTQRLAEGLFSIFCKRDTSEQVRQNIRFLAPLFWPYIEEDVRKSFGIKHAYFSANNHTAEKNFAREFLVVVDGLGYITDQHRAMEVSIILDELKNAHAGLNNFYNELLPTKRLRSIVGNPPKIPNGIEANYVKTLVDIFLTNGNGVCFSADEIYLELIKSFTPRQAVYAIALIFDEAISSKLQIKLCIKKYNEMLDILEPKISIQSAKQLIKEIRSNKIALSDIKADENLRKIAKLSVDESK
jgi:hypothetical protein